MEFTAQQIANVLGGTVDGDPEIKVNNFSKIEEGKPETLTFLANPKYEHYIYSTKASIVLVNNSFVPSEPIAATLIKVANAYASLAILLDMMYIDAVTKGIDDIPTVTQEIREEIYKQYNAEGLAPILEELKQIDPEHYAIVDHNNYKRVIHVKGIFAKK